jgi:hypothetical protein
MDDPLLVGNDATRTIEEGGVTVEDPCCWYASHTRIDRRPPAGWSHRTSVGEDYPTVQVGLTNRISIF